ncbi:class I adenylate-forming enzyme family protein [Streptomyces sp. NPDC056227]|uniref:class I adenylate-forming enzyme family protein n=1 Tax=Streptomyces sp. NPDC056227 TaxID=3345753 RepID=UPI0035E0CEA6
MTGGWSPTGEIAAVVQRNADERPDGPAIIDEQRTCTHAELATEVAAVARGLTGLGVGPGSRVGLLCTNRVEWVTAAYGTLAVGATLAAFPTWARSWDLDHLIAHSRCEVLLTADRVGTTDLTSVISELVPEISCTDRPGLRSATYPALRELVVIGRVPSGARSIARSFADLGAGAADVGGSASAAQDSALVLYTSGSTARPKAVRLAQQAAIGHAREVAARMGVRHDDRILLPVPLFWSYGGANALMVALVTGSTVVLQETFDAAGALTQIARHRCTVLYTLPSITRTLLGEPTFSREAVATLRRGMTIGPPSDVRAAAVELGVTEICNAYGSTELYGGATVTPHDWPLDRRCTGQGSALPGNRVAIIDPQTGRVQPPGELGEIVVSGYTSPGYLDQPDETAASFDPDGTFCTGDLGHLDAGGELHFAGRASEMIRTGGINVSPLEVEDFLLTHSAVEEAVVVGVADQKADQVPIAFVRTASPHDTDEATLLAFCRDRIAAYKVPRRIVLRTIALPRTTTGKPARTSLMEEAQALWKGAEG